VTIGEWVLSVVIAVALGAEYGGVFTTFGCKKSTPDAWIGIDRASAKCAFTDHNYPHNTARCVGSGRVYECVRERYDGDWACAEVTTRVTAPIEAPAP
jgi:hypothetical protein